MKTTLTYHVVTVAGAVFVVLVSLAGIGWYAVATMPATVGQALAVTIWSLAIAASALAVALLLAGVALMLRTGAGAIEAARRERLATELDRAKVAAAWRDANQTVTIADVNQQVFLTEVQPTGYSRPLHLLPHHQINGPGEPSRTETNRWMAWQLSHSTGKSANELPALSGPAKQPTLALPGYVDLGDYVTAPSLRSLFLGMGRFPDGQVRPVNPPLDRLVHIATAGSSGFGKSTFMQALAWQVINAREQPRPVMLDAQGTTFNHFEGDDRLLYPLGSAETDITAILADLVSEMDRRKELYQVIRGVATLRDYNQAADEPLPPVPVFFDEFGLVADNRAIASHVRKLAQGGRKFGLYLIAGAQTWLASDISTALRANLSTTVQFAARDKSQSRVLLSDGAAADLTEPGRAFALLPGQAGLIELQAPDPTGVIEGRSTTAPADRPDLLPETTRSIPTTIEKQDTVKLVVTMHSQGASKASICRALGWTVGGNQYAKIDEILSEAGVL